MEYILPIFFLLLIAITVFLLWNTRREVVFEFERGLLFRQGKFLRILEPGAHWYYRPRDAIRKHDMRARLVSLAGQEILSADNIGLKISMVCKYRVADPYRAVVEVEQYDQALYLELQTHLRDVVGALPIDDFLAKRMEIGQQVLERAREACSPFGVSLEAVSLKDIMFPGELKNIFAQVVNARKEGLAALERARGESAALRNLANSAQLLEKNPALLQLRLLQTLEKNPGNTIILGEPAEGLVGKGLGKKGKK